jgi:adenine-specific DNA-methyltransferase
MAQDFTPSYSFKEDRLNELKQLFPEAFEDGAFNVDTLKEMIGEYSTDNTDKEHFGLNWVGKKDARRNAAKAPTGTLKPCPGEGVNENTTENIFIEGENEEVLKILRKSYSGRIKMIYIDPPYNTGNDFIYKDTFADSTEDYLRKMGEKSDEGLLVSNPKSSGKYHANWLSFMYPRLRVAKDLLKEDGVIFISIDEHEVDNLKKLCDEIFGEENHIGTLMIINNMKGRNDKANIATCHEYLLIYTKLNYTSLGIPLSEEQLSQYKYIDENDEKYALRDLRKRGRPDRREDRPNMYFPIYFNEKTKICSLEKQSEEDIEITPKRGDNSDGRWRWGKERVRKNLSILHPKYSKNKDKWAVEHRVYLNPNVIPLSIDEDSDEDSDEEADDDDQNFIRTSKTKSFWWGGEISTDVANREFKKNISEFNPDYPKSPWFIEKMLHMSLNENDIVLDFFAGTGTTAISLMNFCLGNNYNNKFILVQIPDLIPSTHEAYVAGYRKLTEITQKRIKNYISKYNTKQGFKVYKQEKSTIYKWKDFEIEKDGGMVDLFTNLELAHKSPIKDGVKTQDFISEILLQEGFPLTSNQEEVLSGIFKITHEWVPYTLYITMLYNFKNTDFTKLNLSETDHFVCLDKAFEGNDSLKQQLDNQCKLFTI